MHIHYTLACLQIWWQTYTPRHADISVHVCGSCGSSQYSQTIILLLLRLLQRHQPGRSKSRPYSHQSGNCPTPNLRRCLLLNLHILEILKISPNRCGCSSWMLVHQSLAIQVRRMYAEKNGIIRACLRKSSFTSESVTTARHIAFARRRHRCLGDD